jgi:hypothetical protein
VAWIFLILVGNSSMYSPQESVDRSASKVVWPTRKETMQMTGVVIAFAVRDGAVSLGWLTGR